MKITVENINCRNCDTVHWPKLDDEGNEYWPKYCKNQECRSPYWNKKRKIIKKQKK